MTKCRRFYDLLVIFLLAFWSGVTALNVSYDHRAFVLDGKRRLLISAGIHYPRATPEMWPELIAKAKEGGANAVESYVFWSGHEPRKGEYNFEGRYNLPRFVELVGKAGLYFNLRIGPYVCAEWNFGGFPAWLRDVPGIEFRTDNEPFKEEMETFVRKVVDVMKGLHLFSWQGGPIIMAQIENEYGNIEKAYGSAGQKYLQWVGRMVAKLGADIPWIMCQQRDSPPNVVGLALEEDGRTVELIRARYTRYSVVLTSTSNAFTDYYKIDTCNGYYCDSFKPNKRHTPKMWTEDWNGWYQFWGGTVAHRPVEDNAFAIARFFARGGSYQNYYMYFGGTNFERTSGGPLITTSYDYDAPLDEYGLVREPKWGHLKELHAVLMLCETALLSVDDEPIYISLGANQEAHVYETPGHPETCAAFLSNVDTRLDAVVHFRGVAYELPAWSVSILADCRTVVYNTAKVGTQTAVMSMKFVSQQLQPAVSLGESFLEGDSSGLEWEIQEEPIGIRGEGSSTYYGLKEQLEITKDSSDYLWYTTSFQVSREDAEALKSGNGGASLFLEAVRDALHVFVNGELVGSAFGSWFSLSEPVTLKEGINELALLCMTVGLQNYGAFLEKDGAGLKGKVQVQGLVSGDLNLTDTQWTYQVGLKGEEFQVYEGSSVLSDRWVPASSLPLDKPLIWYRSTFDSPDGQDPVALDLASMGKGQVWVNGHHLGRYWILSAPKGGCSGCDYRGAYKPEKCASGCGEITQRWYHVPREWLQKFGNSLVLFEELGGDPSLISIATRSPDTICAHISNSQPPLLHLWTNMSNSPGGISRDALEVKMRLSCASGRKITQVIFASYGNPSGACGNFYEGFCHASNSRAVVEQECLGKSSCLIALSPSQFEGDLCPGEKKALAVQALCRRANELIVGNGDVKAARLSNHWRRFEIIGPRSRRLDLPVRKRLSRIFWVIIKTFLEMKDEPTYVGYKQFCYCMICLHEWSVCSLCCRVCF